MTSFDELIEKKIREYNPQGNLAETTISFLEHLDLNYPLVKRHAVGVALLAEAVAIRMKKDAKAAFFGALCHDKGKDSMPNYLFDGRDITEEEYLEVKKHSVAGYLALKDKHLFMAYFAGCHHAVNENGYGLTLRDFPENCELRTVKKILEISTIISVCDNIDAALTRNGIMKSDFGVLGARLQERLERKFPDDRLVVQIALEEAEKIIRA